VSLSQLDLNLLVVLETVLAERSVVRAAHRLHVTPSAISNSLARLRHALGDPLVIRSGRGVVPTPRAATLVPSLSRALRDIDLAIHGPAFAPASSTAQFTLAIADAGQIVQVPRLASEFAKIMPRARLRVVGIDTLLSSGGLAGTEVDVAIAAMDPAPGVHLQPLYEEDSVLVARRGHELAGGVVSKRRLESLRHIDVQVAPGIGYRQLAPTYARLDIRRDVALVVPSFVAAAAIVAETDFVATLPKSFVLRFAQTFRIRELTPSAPRVSVVVKLAWHERTEHDAAMRAFREVVAASVQASRKTTSAKRRRR
jgi:DNA-binding transcriptional LysR family regulator